MPSFWDLIRGRMTDEQKTAHAKALNISLAPGGFVNEVVTSIRTGRATSRLSADTASIESLMSVNELVYACVNVKATAARDPRLIVEERVDQNGKITYQEAAGHPLRQLIMRPNPMMTEGDLMHAAIVSWDVSNPRRFYAEKVYDSRGILIELWPLNPAMLRPRYREAAPYDVIGYTWSDSRNRRDYTLDDLLVRAAPAWYDPPPAVAALGAIGADSAQTEYISTFFSNGGIPPIFLKYEMPLNDARRDEIREKWRAIYGGGAAGDIGILDSNSDVRTVGSNLDQLGSDILRQVAESRICMVFGVPPLIVYAYVGLVRATYANLKEAWASFWDACMSPLFKEWRDFWTWELLPEFESTADVLNERVRLNYDMSQVAALQDDVDKIQNRASANYRNRIISHNEARAAVGYGPVDGGDDEYWTSAPWLMPTVQTDPLTTPPKSINPRLAKAASVARQAQVERAIRKDVQQYLEAQYEAAARAVGN